MTRIPPEIIKASIKPGSVYYFKEENISPIQKHYFIVINNSPLTDEAIILACASSKIRNTKRRCYNYPPETLVIITPKQYCGFRVDSIFDCNRIFIQSINNIAQKYTSNELLVKPEMDIGLVEMLRRGVLASRLISAHIKAMLSE